MLCFVLSLVFVPVLDDLLNTVLGHDEPNCLVALESSFVLLQSDLFGRLVLFLEHLLENFGGKQLFELLVELVPLLDLLLPLFFEDLALLFLVSDVHQQVHVQVLEPPENHVGEHSCFDEGGEVNVDLVQPVYLDSLPQKRHDLPFLQGFQHF